MVVDEKNKKKQIHSFAQSVQTTVASNERILVRQPSKTRKNENDEKNWRMNVNKTKNTNAHIRS